MLATALGNGAEIALEAGRLAEGETALHRAVELNRTLGVRTPLADNLNNLGLVRHLRGDSAGSRVYLNEALKLAKALDDNFLEGFARLRLAAVALVCGEDDAAAAGAMLARRLFTASGYAPGEARARLIESELALRAGAYGETSAAAESALEKIGADGSAPLNAQALAARALALRLQDRDPDPGLIAGAERQAEISGHLLAKLLVALRHARLLLCDKQPAAARPLIERVLADARAAGFHWQIKEAEELLKSIR